MDISYQEAISVYESFPPCLRAPALHPYYVSSDALRSRDPITPTFFFYKDAGEVFYYPFHLYIVLGTEHYEIQSAYGYGGPKSTTEKEEFIHKAWDSHIKWCKKNRVIAESVRFHPLLENWKFYKGQIMDNRSTVWVDITHEDLMASYSGRARTAVRKAQKNGFSVQWVGPEKFLDVFPPLYNKTMERIEAGASYFFSSEYHASLAKWEQVLLGICSSERELGASAIFLLDGETMEYHLSASSSYGRKMNATNLLLHEAFLHAKKMGIQRVHLGGGKSAEPNDPLFFFKASFSDRRGAFKIGQHIHNKDAYDALTLECEMKSGMAK